MDPDIALVAGELVMSLQSHGANISIESCTTH